MGETIGFVGLGAMGSRIATRLIGAGHPVVTWTRRGASLAGAETAASPAELAERSRLVIGCLLDDVAVNDVYLSPNGLIASAAAGAVLIEHGTFSPSLARAIAAAAKPRGVEFLDIPVTGGPDGAEQGTLIAMAGGSADVIDARRAVLGSYLGVLERVGDVGAGLTLKLVNQHLVAIHMAAAAEAAALLVDSGIDAEQARRLLMGGLAASRMVDRELVKAVSGRFDAAGGFTIGGLSHVLDLIEAALRDAKVTARVFASAHEVFTAAIADGFGDADPAALVTVARTVT